MKTTWLALTLSLIACASTPRHPAAAEGSAAEVFRLHSGRKVLLPLRSDNLDYVMLQGSASLKTLNEVLAGEDLAALPGPDGQGVVGIFILKHNNSSLGPYQEVLITIRAAPKSLVDAGAMVGNTPAPTTVVAPLAPFFVWQAATDQALAADTAREVWGHPATVGAVELNTTAGDWNFRYQLKNKSLVFEGKCGNCGAVIKQSLPNALTLISSYAPRRSLASVETAGPTVVRPFDGGVDTFNLKPGSPLALLLKRVTFRPVGWMIGTGNRSSNF